MYVGMRTHWSLESSNQLNMCDREIFVLNPLRVANSSNFSSEFSYENENSLMD